MEPKLRGWLQSSQSPEEVANKIKGAILMVSAIVIFTAAQVFHIQLGANDMVTLATEVGAVGGAIWSIYGAFLHLVTWLGTVKAQQ